MKKRERLALIKELVQQEEIETQQELIALLEDRGEYLTQATISRDINEIGLIKRPSSSGRYIYTLAKKKSKAQKADVPSDWQTPILQMSKAIEQPVFLAVDVVPGNSRILKKRLKETLAEELLAVLVDDDTVLVMTKDQDSANRVKECLNQWRLNDKL
ncbi:ArgR family transcriptional regulator [Streptococcus sp. zg-JUN1979]|uniref:ArgR family transcriptional regulator n=1 Tax=Streptococcus sp. zg-JUN1979 TaxID=3391450 RepID=UPI0039A5C445